MRIFLVRVLSTLLVVVLLAAGSPATVTFGSGSGQVSHPGGGMRLTIGQGIAARADHVAGNTMSRLGVWSILGRVHPLSQVGLEVPAARNRLLPNYPNPFNPSTRISFNLAEECEVRIEIYDLRGQKVDTALREVRSAGVHSITYEPRNLSSGVYFLLMRAGGFRGTQRMMLVK
jgi:hypothetical protein